MSAPAIKSLKPPPAREVRPSAACPDRHLALDTLDAFAPFLNLSQCGQWIGDSPKYFISKAQLARNWRRRLSGRDLERAMEGQKHYYTSGRNGRALLYLDLDNKNGEPDK